jgi:hypothetical protein
VALVAEVLVGRADEDLVLGGPWRASRRGTILPYVDGAPGATGKPAEDSLEVMVFVVLGFDPKTQVFAFLGARTKRPAGK